VEESQPIVGYPAVFNGDLRPAAAVCVPLHDDGFLRGDGAFEVVRIYEGRPFALDEHLDRLERSCRILGIAYPRRELERETSLLIEGRGTIDCDMRIVLTRGGSRVVFLESLRPVEAAARLAVVVDRPQPLLQGAKTLSYAANMLAERLARERGATDALLVSPEGLVLEAQTAAFFWVDRQGDVCTPPLGSGILDSITRRAVMRRAVVSERECVVDEAKLCTEAFLAGTTRQVQPVAAIEDRVFVDVPGPRTREAITGFWHEVRARTGVDVTGWLESALNPE